MKQVTVQDAQADLQTLIEAARSGQTILIIDENNQSVKLVPVSETRTARRAGSARGQITLSPDFDAPLSDFDDYTA